MTAPFVQPLRSGSSGNAVLVGAGATRLLFDAGICLRSLHESLSEAGEDAASLSGILITHEHGDHVSGLGAFWRRYRLPVYMTGPTWLALNTTRQVIDEQMVRIVEPDRPFTVGELEVVPFDLPHDAAGPVGYRIHTGHGDLSLMTDLGHPTESLIASVAGSKAVLIEANYDRTMLLTGRYPAIVKQRILGDYGHLSNDDCSRAVRLLMESGSEQFMLAHISRDNNYPELARAAVLDSLSASGAVEGLDFRLDVARRFATSPRLTW